jgi:hypothetical protein
MVSGDAQNGTVLNANNERLHQELAQLGKAIVSVEDRTADNAENGLINQGK